MNKFSILLLVSIAYWAINWNSVQANDEDSFEEGKFLLLSLALLDKDIHRF
jgi:hypothetical protein